VTTNQPGQPQQPTGDGDKKKHDPWDFSSPVEVKESVVQSLTHPKDFVMGLLGMGGTPDNYPAASELAKSEAMAGSVYGDALAQGRGIARSGAPTSTVTSQQIGIPSAITAQTIGTPDTLGGGQAADLRATQLAQARTAAESPSSAAAAMRASAGLIGQQQLGQAAMARGADRASAKRDAMLATGTQGMVAANQAAALAAQEQAAKQQAYTQALSGVRAGDVSGAQAQTQIGAANQSADLQAQQITGQQGLTAAMANQGADLDASKFTAGNLLAGWQAQQQAANAAYNTALQAVGAQNQAQGIASGYATGQNQAAAQMQGAGLGAIGGIVGAAISDERAKTDVYQLGASQNDDVPYQYPNHEPIDFLAWEPSPPPKQPEQKGLIESLLSDEKIKREVKRLTAADETADALRSTYGLVDDGNPYQTSDSPYLRDVSEGERAEGTSIWEDGLAEPDATVAPLAPPNAADNALPRADVWHGGDVEDPYLDALSDERTKREVDRMGARELVSWAERVPMATFRYKEGAPDTDGGEDYHLGTLAQSLERTGPMGRLMVHRRDDGLREVEYGPLALAIAKAALVKASEKGGR
jgi:hypothetical protein